MKRITDFIVANPRLMRLYRNAGIIFGGNMASAAINLLVLAVLARAVSLHDFGVYSLVTAYIMLMDRLTSFQTWQALIHYGAHAKQEQKFDRLTSLLAFGFLLDIGAGVAGFILALIGVALVPQWIGVDSGSVLLVGVAATTLLVNWIATPTAILRLFDSYYPQALYQKVMATIRLIGFAVLWWSGEKSLMSYMIIWTIGGIIGRILFVYMAWRIVRHNNLGNRHAVNFVDMFSHCHGLWKFVLTTNLDGMVRVVRELDIFIVNALLGTAATALYKIGRELTKVLSKLTGPFYQAIYPDLAHMAAEKDFISFRKLMKQSSITLGGVIALGWVGFAVIGKWGIGLAFGPDFVPAYPVALWCMAAMVVWAFAQPLSPAMRAIGQVTSNLVVHSVTTLLYMGLLYGFTQWFGLWGSGLAMFLFYVAWSLGMLACILTKMNQITGR